MAFISKEYSKKIPRFYLGTFFLKRGQIHMGKDFDVQSKVNFPSYLVEKEIDGFHIIIAPDYPNWLILDDKEFNVYKILKQKTIIDGLNTYYEKYPGNTEDSCLTAFTEFLTKVEDCQFYADSFSADEEPIERIKKKIHITLTNDCNMRCPHCFVSAGIVSHRELDVEKILSVVQAIEKINGPSEIVVSGGEPLIHKEALKLLKGLKNHHVSLFTNGTLINEDNYKVIADSCEEVQISFEGVTELVYEKIRGKGNYKKAFHAIELLKQTGIKITIAVTILPITMDDINKNLVNFVKQLDYKNLEIRLTDDIELAGNALTLDLSKYDKSSVDKIIIRLLAELQHINVSKKIRDGRNIKFKNCGIGTNIVIDADGKIYPCNKFSKYYKTLNESVGLIFKEFNDLNNKTSIDFLTKCLNCELKYICSGGCRIDYLNRNGNMTKFDCTPEYKEKQYRKLLLDYLV